MSFLDCIVNGRTEGNLNDDQAKLASDLFIELETEYSGSMNRGQAQAQAAKDTFDALKRISIEKKRKKLLQVQAFKNIEKNLRGYRDAAGNANYGKASASLIDADVNSNFSSLVQRENAIKQTATAKLYDVLATFKRNLIGEVRNKAQLKNMVREVFGQDTGDVSAKEFALAWKEAAEYLRLEFNRAGGSIARRSDWGMPQIHDMVSVGKVSRDEWINFVKDKLDLDKMLDETTGLKFTEDRLYFALTDVYETISSGGLNKVKPDSIVLQGKSISNRRQDHRFLVFKNADVWLEYQEKFGNSNPFDTMIGHISSMSKEIAQMDVLGPNPSASINYIKTQIKKEVKPGDQKGLDAANKQGKYLDTLYDAFVGVNNAPIDSFFGNTFAGLRQILQSAQLGSAAIAALTDMNFGRLTRGFVGLPQVSTVTDYLKFLNPLGAKEKGKLAVRLGLIAEGWTSIAAAQMRYIGDISGPEITRRIGDFVMRASFLSPFTTAGRWSFGMEFLGYLGDQVNKNFNQLDDPIKKTLERYGLGSDKWDIIRSSDLYTHEGASFLSVENIRTRTDIDADTARNVSLRVMEMINTETNFAVPSTSLRGRVSLVGDTSPGTISGELTRSFAMYKNFGVTLVNTHLLRGVTQQGAKRKGSYMADFLISSSVMGALALQLKEMTKGRDPRPMTDAEFWTAAFLQGGGLGIYGDFLFSDYNRYGGSLGQTIAGPVIGFGDDLIKMSAGNIHKTIKGDDVNLANDLVRFAGKYTPGSSLWYARLALERGVLDQLNIMADPKAKSKMRRTVKRYKKQYGQNYWWKPGNTSPRRSPNLENIFEVR